MSKNTQISARISEKTRRLMEQHVRRTGVKKGHLVEQALLHHLQALDEITSCMSRAATMRGPTPMSDDWARSAALNRRVASAMVSVA